MIALWMWIALLFAAAITSIYKIVIAGKYSKAFNESVMEEEPCMFATDADGMAPRHEMDHHFINDPHCPPEPVIEDATIELQDRIVVQMRHQANNYAADRAQNIVYYWQDQGFTYHEYMDLLKQLPIDEIPKGFSNWKDVPASVVFTIVDKLEMLESMKENDMAGVMHTTQEGKKIPIYRMENAHLIRTIAYFSTKILEAYNDTVGAGSLVDEVMLGGDERKNSVESLKSKISEGYSMIGRFVLEAVRRGLSKDAEEALAPFPQVMESLDGFSRPGSAALPKALSYKTDETLGF
jgi:hypothetical protein